MRGGAIRPGALLVSPVFFGSIALLLLNDRVLKAAWPGLVTGKLSDVAGVAMVAILLMALFRRRDLAFGLTVVTFIALKVVPLVALWASPVLGGVTRTDPTDLVALLVLVPLWRWVQRCPTPGGARAAWALPLQIIAVSSAVFATSATGCDSQGVGQFFVAADGTLIADVYPMQVSRDGGLTWEQETLDYPAPGDHRCFDDGLCLELDRFEAASFSSSDGATLMSFDEAQVAALGELDQPSCFESAFGDIVVVQRDGVDHVVVAMGWLGVLHAKRGEPYEWVAVGPWGIQRQDAGDQPLGFSVAAPIDDAGIGLRLPTWVSIALMGAAWSVLVASIAPMRRLAMRKRRSPTPVTAALQLAALALAIVGAYLIVFSYVFEATRSDQTAVALLFAGTTLAILVLIAVAQSLVPARSGELPPPEPVDRVG